MDPYTDSGVPVSQESWDSAVSLSPTSHLPDPCICMYVTYLFHSCDSRVHTLTEFPTNYQPHFVSVSFLYIKDIHPATPPVSI